MARPKKENPDPSETHGTSRRHNRRQALGLAGVAAAAAAVAALGVNGGKKAEAAAGFPLILGEGNDGEGQTTGLLGTAKGAPGVPNVVLRVDNLAAPPLEEGEEAIGLAGWSQHGDGIHGATYSDNPQHAAVKGFAELLGQDPEAPPSGAAMGVQGNSGTGPGVEGISQSGPGVEAHSGSGPGVEGHSQSGVGVLGHSVELTGVTGRSEQAFGVHGITTGSSGVVGQSESSVGVVGGTGVGGSNGLTIDAGENGKGALPPAGVLGDASGDFAWAPGVEGHSGSGPGVHGYSESGYGLNGDSQSGIGVQASSETGLALAVVGKARFSTAGDGVALAKSDAATVSDSAVTADSHITVTFTGDPGRARVAWVDRQADTGFTVHLSSRCRSDVPFTYLIVEPGV